MSNLCKYYKQIKQVSYDGGATWQDVVPAEYRKGELYEADSVDCGYGKVEKWITSGTICSGFNLYYKLVKLVSYDGGKNWETTYETKLGDLIEVNTAECGYAPGDYKFYATYTGGTSYSAECDSSTILSYRITKPNNSNYSAMTAAIIGGCITSIGYGAFENCISLASIEIPNSVTEIDTSAFVGCISLTSVVIPSGVNTIKQGAFAGCSGLTNVTIGENVTVIDGSAFSHCVSLTGITLPPRLAQIGQYTFQNCISLTSVVIPDSVYRIADWAFIGCSGLTDVTIGSGTSQIGNSAFTHCSSLESVTIKATTPPSISATLGGGVFDDTNDCPIYVPSESLDTYRNNSGWNYYASRIYPIPT